MEMYIVLAVTLFMMISFILHKVPFGVTTMACCLILAMTGIMDVQSAFSGFGNKIVVLIAPMLALSSVLTKTSLVARISSVMNTIKGRRGMLLVASFFLIGAIFAQFIPTTAAITILVVFLSTLDNTGDYGQAGPASAVRRHGCLEVPFSHWPGCINLCHGQRHV